MMKCPVCRATYRSMREFKAEPTAGETRSAVLSPASLSTLCRRCGVDLFPLIQIHDQALWHYRQALQLTANHRLAEARASNEQALALNYGNADFHALAGRLWALDGEFSQAIAAWRVALSLDPRQTFVQQGLQYLTESLD